MWCVCTAPATSCPCPCLATASSQVSPNQGPWVPPGMGNVPVGHVGQLLCVTARPTWQKAASICHRFPDYRCLCNPIKAVPASLSWAARPGQQRLQGSELGTAAFSVLRDQRGHPHFPTRPATCALRRYGVFPTACCSL